MLSGIVFHSHRAATAHHHPVCDNQTDDHAPLVITLRMDALHDWASLTPHDEGQLLVEHQSIRGERRKKPFESDSDFIEELLSGYVITATQLPGRGSPCHRIEGSPGPNLVFIPSTKCHISSACTALSAVFADGHSLYSAC